MPNANPDGIPDNWDLMNKSDRARYLLELGVDAKIDIDRRTLVPVYVAVVNGNILIPCGHYGTANDAIIAGTDWLSERALLN